MSDRLFTITMTETQRLASLYALAFMRQQMYSAVQLTEPILDLMGKLTAATGTDQAIDQPIARPVSRPAPVTKLDYFQRDRKGVAPTIAPTDAELMTVNVVAATEKPIKNGRALEVIYNVAGKGGKAKCFDASLWPYITPRQGQTAELWILESGNYLNIVGVRA
jgi:hypothetical protein